MTDRDYLAYEPAFAEHLLDQGHAENRSLGAHAATGLGGPGPTAPPGADHAGPSLIDAYGSSIPSGGGGLVGAKVRGLPPGPRGAHLAGPAARRRERGADLLERKLRILLAEEKDYALQAERTRAEWARAVGDLETSGCCAPRCSAGSAP